MPKQVITFHYELKGDQGEIIDTSKGGQPLSFLEGSNQIIQGLANFLLTVKVGESQEVTVPYQEAYGAYDQKLVAQVPRSQFPPSEVKAGDMFQVEKEGVNRNITIIDIAGDMVTVDANHPLAGKDLAFWVQVTERRDATPEEIAHGHVHSH